MTRRPARIVDALLPRGTRRRAAVNWLAVHVLPRSIMLAAGLGEPKLADAYRRWIEEIEPSLFERTAERAAAIADPPRISVVVPTYNTPARYFDPLVRSLLEQVYPHWELCIADGSDDPKAAERIAAAAKADQRIRVRRLATNDGISGNTNRAIEMAEGEFVALLDHDDVLSRFALAEVALAIDGEPDVDLVYSDEDKLSEDGSTRSLGVLKPDWSPDMLLGGNYITHLAVVRRSLLTELGGERSPYDGAQDYDLALRVSERARRVVHVPKVLYHWRFAEGSTAVDVAAKDYAGDAGRRALADALGRRHVDAEVLRVPRRTTFYRVQYRLPDLPPVATLIVPFREEEAESARRCVASILGVTSYAAYEIVIVAAEPEGRATAACREAVTSDARVRFVSAPDAAGAARLATAGRAAARGEYLVLLHPDVEATDADWLREVVSVAAQPGVGAVAPLLRYPGGAVQHAGVVLGLAGGAGHPWRWRDQRSFTFFGSAEWPRDFLTLGGGCVCVRTDRYDAAGGLAAAGPEPVLALGVALHRSGLRNVYWPYVSLRHAESLAHERGGALAPEAVEPILAAIDGLPERGDPSFNPNLDPALERISLRSTR